MDTGRQEGVSNSPSDSQIVRIQHGGAAGGVVRVDLSDGSSFFVGAREASSEKLEVGRRLSEANVERLRLLQEMGEARRKALELLAAREQPRARLALKLAARGFNDGPIQRVLDELESSGAIDDLRFARLWIDSRNRRNPSGRARLYAGLLGQGVPRVVAEQALRDWSEEDEQEALQRAYERISMTKAAVSREKALKSLARRGFSVASARKVVDLPQENN